MQRQALNVAPLPEPGGQRWLSILNADSQTIPPFAVCLITDVNADGFATVTRPSADNQVRGIVFNGPIPVPEGEYGQATETLPAIAAYEQTEGDGSGHAEPVAGEVWGAVNGSWKLQEGFSGYVILGGAADGLVNVTRDPVS